MSKLFIEDTSLTAIGDAIRGKTGGTELLSVPSGMVEAINGIQTGGGALKCVFSTKRTTGGTYNDYDVDLGGAKLDLANCLIFFKYTVSGSMTSNDCMYIGTEGVVRSVSSIDTTFGFDAYDDLGTFVAEGSLISAPYSDTVRISQTGGTSAEYIAVFYV